MKTILSAIMLLSTSMGFARDLYPEELIKTPSKDYRLIILKNINMKDKRSKIVFYKGKIVKNLPNLKDVLFCELKNARIDGTKITLEKGNVFRFSSDEGFNWKHFVTGRIWRKRMFFWDNDDVQYFNCSDTNAFQNNIPSDGVIYKNIKKAVGGYLKITLE